MVQRCGGWKERSGDDFQPNEWSGFGGGGGSMWESLETQWPSAPCENLWKHNDRQLSNHDLINSNESNVVANYKENSILGIEIM